MTNELHNDVSDLFYSTESAISLVYSGLRVLVYEKTYKKVVTLRVPVFALYGSEFRIDQGFCKLA